MTQLFAPLVILVCVSAVLSLGARHQWLKRLEKQHDKEWQALGYPRQSLHWSVSRQQIGLVFSGRSAHFLRKAPGQLDSLGDPVLSRILVVDKYAMIASTLGTLLYCVLFLLAR